MCDLAKGQKGGGRRPRVPLGLGSSERRRPGALAPGAWRAQGWGLAGRPAGWALAQGAAVFLFQTVTRAEKHRKEKSKRAPKILK